MKYNSKKLVQIAMQNEQGFTVDKRTLKPIEKGFSIGVKETQDSFGYKGLIKAFFVGINNPKVSAFGGWLNSENRKYYYDACIIVHDFREALELAKSNEQISFYDLSKGKEIKLSDIELINTYLSL